MRPLDPRLLRRLEGARAALAGDVAFGVLATVALLAQATLFAHAVAGAFGGSSLRDLVPTLVLLGAVVWVYFSSGTFWAVVLLVWTVFAGSFDNVLRPILIRRGADVPLLLIFSGVIGGLLAFGLIGLFVGPVVLSVTFTLLENWVTQGPPRPEAPAPTAEAAQVADS